MTLKIYSYGNIVRILAIGSEDFSDALMVDVNIDDKSILSVFDGVNKFDADFIRSYLNILRESRVGFRLMTESKEDTALRDRAFAILEVHSSEYNEICRLLSIKFC